MLVQEIYGYFVHGGTKNYEDAVLKVTSQDAKLWIHALTWDEDPTIYDDL